MYIEVNIFFSSVKPLIMLYWFILEINDGFFFSSSIMVVLWWAYPLSFYILYIVWASASYVSTNFKILTTTLYVLQLFGGNVSPEGHFYNDLCEIYDPIWDLYGVNVLPTWKNECKDATNQSGKIQNKNSHEL